VGPAAHARGMGKTYGRSSQWGAIVGKETKFGLLVGVAFIVLFGVILGGRVGSAAGDHAPLPVGDSGGHKVLVDTILGSQDPLESDARLLAMDKPALAPGAGADAETAEAPAPGGEAPSREAPAPAEPEPIGRLTLAPARVETPMPMPAEADAPQHPAEPVDVSVHEPPAPEPASPAPVPQRPVHVVAKGETLTTIAKRYYGSDGARLWRRIWEANKDRLADPHRLDLGQSLVIPGLPAETPPAATEVADASGAEAADDAGGGRGSAPPATLDELARRFEVRLDDGEVVEDPAAPPPTYTIQKGDTFYSIARKVYGDPSLAKDLVRKNRDRVRDARRLRVGQTILLLARSQTAAAEPTEERVVQVAHR